MENYEVKFIVRKGGNTKVRYTVQPSDAEPEENIISRSDNPHQDFLKLWALLPNVARRMLEFPLENEDCKELHVWVTKVNFVFHKDFGEGMQLVVLIDGFKNFAEPLMVVTRKFYVSPIDYYRDELQRQVPLQMLLPDEVKLMHSLAQEAFYYAYYCKREQPTVEEAQRAYESGGYPDEEGQAGKGRNTK